MTGKTTAATLLIITSLFCTVLAWSQAYVDESLETQTLYVDAVKGNDNNPGTQQQPLKTIAAAATDAIANNHNGLGTKVIINPGTYREMVSMVPMNKDTSLPITFEAATPGQSVMSGADISTGWTVYSGSVYVNSWANRWGLCDLDSTGAPTEEDIVRRREMLIINRMPMMQVMTLSAVSVPGTFYVDENKGKIYVWPPTGTNMNTATIEIPTRANLFVIGGRQNIVLRGLTFKYANSCRNDAAVRIQFDASNILIDNSMFNWNNAEGLRVWFTTNTTVQNSIANHNGESGMKGFETKYDLWQDNTTRYNGWRGAQGVYYAWGAAGTHYGLAHNQTIHNLDTSLNQTHGIHWDTDNENNTADGIVAINNQLTNGFYEKTQGPVSVSNSYFCSSGAFLATGILGFELRNSDNVTLTGNTYYGNTNAINVQGQAGGIAITDWETGQNYNVITQHLTLTNSVIQSGSGQYLVNNGALGGSDWTKFQSSLISDNNTWWNGTATMDYYVASPKTWTLVDFAGWKSATGADAHSVWKSPSYPSQCTVSAGHPDFWFVMKSLTGYQTVSAGQSATFTVYGVPLNFTGNLKLSSDGASSIPGVTASWSSTTIPSSGSATFTVKTSSSTPKGAHNITLLANNGSLTRTMTITVTVQ